MFREMRRIKQQISREECIEILKNEPRGVLSVIGDDGYPYGVPMNHFYCEEDGKIYFHGGFLGHKIDAIKANDKVSFCVYDKGVLEEIGGSLCIKSVVIFGRAKLIEDREKTVELCRRLCYKFTQDEAYIEDEIAKFAAGTLCFELVPEHMTGKLVHER